MIVNFQEDISYDRGIYKFACFTNHADVTLKINMKIIKGQIKQFNLSCLLSSASPFSASLTTSLDKYYDDQISIGFHLPRINPTPGNVGVTIEINVNDGNDH